MRQILGRQMRPATKRCSMEAPAHSPSQLQDMLFHIPFPLPGFPHTHICPVTDTCHSAANEHTLSSLIPSVFGFDTLGGIRCHTKVTAPSVKAFLLPRGNNFPSPTPMPCSIGPPNPSGQIWRVGGKSHCASETHCTGFCKHKDLDEFGPLCLCIFSSF